MRIFFLACLLGIEAAHAVITVNMLIEPYPVNSKDPPRFTVEGQPGDSLQDLMILARENELMTYETYDTQTIIKSIDGTANVGVKAWAIYYMETGTKVYKKMETADISILYPEDGWLIKFNYQSINTNLEKGKSKCSKTMRKGGISDLFAKHVSHAIHSLTVEDLKMYFTKKAGENNKIPVVNHRLRDQPRVLENAPMIGYDEEFRTGGMKHFDLIMKGIMMPGWNLTAFEVLEKLSHVYHMSEIWVQAGEKYKEVAKTLDKNSELCGCVRDMDSNGLAKYIQLTAFQIRYPGITSGNKEITDKYLGGYLDYHISYGLQERPKNLVEALMDFDFNDTDEALIPGVVDNLMDEAGFNAEPHDPYEEALHSQEHWEWCVGELKKLLTPELVYDTAVFMHCQLNLEK